MLRLILSCLFISCLFNSFQIEAKSVQKIVDGYQKGLELADSGQYAEAAKVWIEYADSLAEPDYRLGHELIEMVTKHRLTEYYEKASEIYLKSLAINFISDEIQELLYNEHAFIEPMLGQRESRRLKRLIDDKNTEIFSYIENFWAERSLTPSDTYNERLMEHWERVNYARENYNTSSRSLFDDRGKMYIRFGPPNRTRSGIFMYNPGFANYIISTRMDDGRGRGSALDNAINTTTYLNTLYQVREYHQYPSFEVWVYTNLTPGPDNVVYLFGNDTGGDVMSLKRSVDDFIPSAAYSSTKRNNPVSMGELNTPQGSGAGDSGDSGDGQSRDTDVLSELGDTGIGNSERITPALVLQFMYYRQLVTLDPFFSSRYDEMLDHYMNTSIRISNTTARQFQQVNTSRLLIAQREVPDEYSTNKNEIFDIDPGVYSYRFFDENMNPELRVYFAENVDEAVTFEELKKRNNLGDVRYSDYELIRTLDLINSNGERVNRLNDKTVLGQPENDPLSSNMIRVPQSNGLNRLHLVSELYDRTSVDQNSISENSTLRSNLKGMGIATATVDPEISSTGFFASDVIIGYSSDSAGDDNFTISHNKVIPENSNIKFYYEAYNIPQNENGLYSFTLTYTIKRDRSLFGRIIRLGRVSSTSMTIENTHDSPNFPQLLEIVSGSLSEGDYILELEISSEGQQEISFTKEVSFKVE